MQIGLAAAGIKAAVNKRFNVGRAMTKNVLAETLSSDYYSRNPRLEAICKDDPA